MKKGHTLKDLYEERSKLYEKYADIIIDAKGCSVEELVDKIIKEQKLLQKGRF